MHKKPYGISNLYGQRMAGQHITVNGQKVFSPYSGYDQTSEQQQKKDESKDIRDTIKEALTSNQLTPKQRRALEVYLLVMAERNTAEFSGSVMQEAACRLCMDRKTYDEHLMRAAAKHRGVTCEQIKKDAAPLRRTRRRRNNHP